MNREKLYTGKKKFLYKGEYPIRWDDIDSYQHVAVHVYLMYLVEIRFEWFYQLPFHKEIKLISPTVSTSGKYHRALTYPGKVIANVYGTPTTDKTFSFYHEIFHSNAPDKLCAEALVELIYIDHKTMKPASIPDKLRDAIYSE